VGSEKGFCVVSKSIETNTFGEVSHKKRLGIFFSRRWVKTASPAARPYPEKCWHIETGDELRKYKVYRIPH